MSRRGYTCKACSNFSTRWTGQCSACKKWDTLEEVRATPPVPGKHRKGAAGARHDLHHKAPAHMAEVIPLNTLVRPAVRHPVGMAELDRVLGGGLVGASTTLLAGDPGIGKSTLLLQAAAAAARGRQRTTCVSGEEASTQVQLRAARIGLADAPVQLIAGTALIPILNTLEQDPPVLVVIDSMQTMWVNGIEAALGSVSQVRACAHRCLLILPSALAKCAPAHTDAC